MGQGSCAKMPLEYLKPLSVSLYASYMLQDINKDPHRYKRKNLIHGPRPLLSFASFTKLLMPQLVELSAPEIANAPEIAIVLGGINIAFLLPFHRLHPIKHGQQYVSTHCVTHSTM